VGIKCQATSAVASTMMDGDFTSASVATILFQLPRQVRLLVAGHHRKADFLTSFGRASENIIEDLNCG